MTMHHVGKLIDVVDVPVRPGRVLRFAAYATAPDRRRIVVAVLDGNGLGVGVAAGFDAELGPRVREALERLEIPP